MSKKLGVTIDKCICVGTCVGVHTYEHAYVHASVCMCICVSWKELRVVVCMPSVNIYVYCVGIYAHLYCEWMHVLHCVHTLVCVNIYTCDHHTHTDAREIPSSPAATRICFLACLKSPSQIGLLKLFTSGRHREIGHLPNK